ncbi:glucosaminidase domain-containing protein [Staphylococcus chromogenes]|uniref:glucosaminidase domain-containing protein n=1 Tax=Staphylococcus chromogenes TaxID=46126 RepID=UPI003D7BD82D
MGLPKSGKPTASQVVDWALNLAENRITINVDGRYGGQCWDLPNYLLKRYWGFFTWGNAREMSIQSNYRGYPFKIYRNTRNFVPKPGDWAVWNHTSVGHVAIVVGPSTKNYFYSVDQNWYTANWSGSPAYKIKHTYNGVSHFVRPPYKKEKAPLPTPDNPEPKKPTPTTQTPTPEEESAPVSTSKIVMKDVTKIKYTMVDTTDDVVDNFQHFVAWGKLRGSKPKGLTIRNTHSMRSVKDMYDDRNKYETEDEYPHYYVDRQNIWHCRDVDYEVPSDPKNVVIEIAEDYSANSSAFTQNEIWGMIVGAAVLVEHKIPLKFENVKADDKMWRSLKEHVNWDIIKDGLAPPEKYDKLVNYAINLYLNKDKFLHEKPIVTTERTKIKTIVNNINADNTVVTQKTSTSNNKTPKRTTPKIIVETSGYTFGSALNRQMRINPQTNYGNGWFGASTNATRNAMNPTKIWGSTVQRYQMLNLNKYQGIPASKLNTILRRKGTLEGQGQAFATAGKKYNINEVYLIAHAFVESGHGTSYFASGKSGVYNYYGIGAFDNNPDNAIAFARKRGWTSASKGIIGGAAFIGNDYIKKGQNTLYRMRWNPKAPGTHQYATDINWCSLQARIIHDLYKKMGLSGLYYIRDKYR